MGAITLLVIKYKTMSNLSHIKKINRVRTALKGIVLLDELLDGWSYLDLVFDTFHQSLSCITFNNEGYVRVIGASVKGRGDTTELPLYMDIADSYNDNLPPPLFISPDERKKIYLFGVGSCLSTELIEWANGNIKEFTYKVTVKAFSKEEADAVIGARLGHDEPTLPDHTVMWMRNM